MDFGKSGTHHDRVLEQERHLPTNVTGIKVEQVLGLIKSEFRLRSGIDRAAQRWFTPAILARRRRLALRSGVRIDGEVMERPTQQRRSKV